MSLFLVDFKQLQKAANKVNVKSIALDGEGVAFLSDKGKFTLKSEKVGEFPIEFLFDKPEWESGLILGDRISVLSKFTEKKDTYRPAMNGIFISDTGLAATDNKRLHWYDYTTSLPQGKSVIIPNLPWLEGEYYVIKQRNYLKMISEGYTLVTSLIDERFPDFKSVIPSSNPIKIRVDRKELISTIELAMDFTNPNTYQIFLNLSDEFFIRAEDIDLSSEYKSNPLSFSGEGEIVIGFNGKLLLEYLKTSKEKETLIEMSASNRGAIFDGCHLLMPILPHYSEILLN